MSGWWDVAIAAFGSYAQSRENDRGRRAEARDTERAQRTGGDEDRRTVAFTRALDDYYKQAGNARARKSLANFSRFSRYQPGPNEAPLYRPEDPMMPTFDQYAYKEPGQG